MRDRAFGPGPRLVWLLRPIVGYRLGVLELTGEEVPMSSTGHAYHPGLLGYDERQIWFDGCDECERRGTTVPLSIGSLDDANKFRAWCRAALDRVDADELGPVSKAERPLLDFLGYAQQFIMDMHNSPDQLFVAIGYVSRVVRNAPPL